MQGSSTASEAPAVDALSTALTFFEQGEVDAAADACWAILMREPQNAAAQQLMGLIFFRQGRHREAVHYLQRAALSEPGRADYQNSLGAVLASQGKRREAADCFLRATTLRPDFAQAHVNLACVFREVGKWELAEASARRALAIDASYGTAHQVLGTLHQQQGRLLEAIRSYRTAIRCGADPARTLKHCALAFSEAGRAKAAVRCLSRAVAAQPGNAVLHSDLLYAMLSEPTCLPSAFRAESCEWARRHAGPHQAAWQPHLNNRSPSRRLRIGYVSGDFREHTRARFVEPVLQQHDHHRFEIYCYSDVAKPDEITQRIRSYADVWREVAHLSAAKLSELIRQDGIDILLELTGHMGGNRLPVFARKPAPVQVAFPGYPATTGIAAIDYCIIDSLREPPGQAEDDYAEKLFRLPRTSHCYLPSAADPQPAKEPPCVRNGFVTFGVLNKPVKVNTAMLRLWAKVLERLPGSRLLLFVASIRYGARRALGRLARAGIEPQRADLVEHASRREYMRLYDRVDVCLDTFPYNGHTTTFDAAWMGTPTVTLAGKTCVSREGLTINETLGLSDLITHDFDEYVTQAVSLGQNWTRLKQLKATLRDRMACSLFMDKAGLTRDLEAAYRTMWTEWCATEQ